MPSSIRSEGDLFPRVSSSTECEEGHGGYFFHTSVFLVFEPCLQENASGSGCLVHIDNPTFLVQLSELSDEQLLIFDRDSEHQQVLNEWIQEARGAQLRHFDSDLGWEGRDGEGWRSIGNDFFLQKQFSPAIQAYTLGIEVSLSKNALSNDDSGLVGLGMLYSNRAHALLKIEEYLLAAKDSEKAIGLLIRLKDPNMGALTKAVHRLALALTNLHAYDQALTILAKYPRLVMKSKPLQELKADLGQCTMAVAPRKGEGMVWFVEKILKQHRKLSSAEFGIVFTSLYISYGETFRYGEALKSPLHNQVCYVSV